MRRALSIVEVILAAGLFAVFASGVAVAVMGGLNTNRSAVDQAIATQYAAEGLEAVRSIKNQGWANLVNTAGTGVIKNAGVWAFGGASNSTDSGRFTRTIAISSVNRDASGNIVLTGTPVPDTKKVVANVTWTSGARNLSADVTSYLTNWKAQLTAGTGLIAYGNGATTRARAYDSIGNVFGSEGPTFAGAASGVNLVVKTSPIRQEAIVGYVSGGTLQIMCFDGTTWFNEWNVSGLPTATVGFDISYETTSGDVMVAYTTNTASVNAVNYRIKLGTVGCGSGTGWSVASGLPGAPTLTSGIVRWVRLESNPVSGSDGLAIAWSDAAADLGAGIWNGSSWSSMPAAPLETNLEFATASGDASAFDLAYESTSGNLMVAWGLFQAAGCTAGTTIAATNCIRYVRYTGSWSAVAAIPTVADPATNIDMSANPNSNELVLAALDNSQADLSIGYWSGSTWTGRANQDTSTIAAAAGTKLVVTGWLVSGATVRSLVVYDDTTNATCLNGFVGNGSTYTRQGGTGCWFTPAPLWGNPQRWFDVQINPADKSQLVMTVSDTNNDLFGKRLVMDATPVFTWTNSDGGAALQLTLGQAIARPFSFAFWRQ